MAYGSVIVTSSSNGCHCVINTYRDVYGNLIVDRKCTGDCHCVTNTYSDGHGNVSFSETCVSNIYLDVLSLVAIIVVFLIFFNLVSKHWRRQHGETPSRPRIATSHGASNAENQRSSNTDQTASIGASSQPSIASLLGENNAANQGNSNSNETATTGRCPSGIHSTNEFCHCGVQIRNRKIVQ